MKSTRFLLVFWPFLWFSDAFRCLQAQMLWPRSSLELYGSYASGLGLRNSGLDLLLKAWKPCKALQRGENRVKTGEDEELGV